MSTPSPSAFIPDPPVGDDDLFSRAFKNWREWNNVLDFLTNLHFGVDEAEIFSLKADPPDVICREARFEVKEIMDAGRKRHDEAKAARAMAKVNGGRARVLESTAKDVTPAVAGDWVLAELDRLSKKAYSSDARRNTDMLFYINKQEYWFAEGPMPDRAAFEPYGWRSVSAVIATQHSLIFHAQLGAPGFLTDNDGKVRARWEPLCDQCTEAGTGNCASFTHRR